MNAEVFERKVKQLESDKAELERKFEEMSGKYNEVKAELATTLQGLEDL
jgi:prefoldin subunit 5